MENDINNKLLHFHQKAFDELYIIDTLVQMTKKTCQDYEFSGQYYDISGEMSSLLSAERNSYINMLNIISERISNLMGVNLAIEREISLQEYIEPATKIYADLSSDLLETIFFPNGPLHDGGVIIQGDRITAAGAVFKTSMNPNISKRLGTRHRAALGIAEESDAIALVVSEESGRISVAVDGELNYNLTLDEFRMLLIDALNPKPEVFYEAEDKKSAGEE